MRELFRIVKLFLLLIFSISPLAAEEPFEETGFNAVLRGSFKNLFVYRERDDYIERGELQGEKKNIYADLNRLRLSPELSYGEAFLFHADLDSECIFSNYRDSREFDLYWKGTEYNDPVNLSGDVYDKNSTYGRLKIHRAYVKASAGDFTLSAGRQLVRFGSSRLWNPLDLFNPLSPTSVEGAEDQTGTDAARLNWFFHEKAEFSAVINPRSRDDDPGETGFDTANYAGRLRVSPTETDLAFLAGRISKRKTAALDFARVLFDGMLTGVFLYAVPEHGDSWFQAGGGYEYNFSWGLYFLAEYFYNSEPVNDNPELQAAALSFVQSGYSSETYDILANRIITYNSHYLSAALGYDFTPLLRGDAFFIADIQGRNMFFSFSLKYNMFENFDISAGLSGASGSEEEGETSDFRDYRRSPLLHASARYYF